ncbi:hypothetical protein D3C81_1972560 [compost metagenome]
MLVFRLQPPAEQFGGGAELAHRTGCDGLALGTGEIPDDHAADVAFIPALEGHRGEVRGLLAGVVAAAEQQAEQSGGKAESKWT